MSSFVKQVNKFVLKIISIVASLLTESSISLKIIISCYRFAVVVCCCCCCLLQLLVGLLLARLIKINQSIPQKRRLILVTKFVVLSCCCGLQWAESPHSEKVNSCYQICCWFVVAACNGQSRHTLRRLILATKFVVDLLLRLAIGRVATLWEG